MKQLTINFDCDNVIANTPKAVLDLYREITGDYSTELTDLKGWDLKDICPKLTKEEIYDLFINPRLFELLEPTEGAVETLEILHSMGHKLRIVTLHNPLGIPYKHQWLRKYFPFISEVIYGTLVQGKKMDKDFITHDVIVDDSPEILSTSPCKYKICYGDYPYNKNYDGMKAFDMLKLEFLIFGIREREGRLNG